MHIYRVFRCGKRYANQRKCKRAIAQWGVAFVASLLIAILIEICGFNYQSLETHLFATDNASIENQQSTSALLEFSNSSTIIIPVTGSVTSLSFTANPQSTVFLSISATDEGNQIPYELGQVSVMGSSVIKLNPSGNLTSLRITSIEDSHLEDTVELRINAPIPFSIGKKRVLAMTAIIFVGFAISLSSPLARKRYNAGKAFPLVIGAVSALGLFFFCMVSAVPADTPGYQHHHQYFELAQALASGQTSLLVKPSPELLSLDNPYDTAARTSSGAVYLWDHAYFNGKYYVYFGVLPAIIYYLPFYLITSGGELPNWIAVGLSFFLFSAGLVFLLFNCCRKWFPETNQANFLLGYATLLLGSWAIPSAQCPDLYNVPISLGLACATWGIAFLIKATTPAKISLSLACLGTFLLSLTILCRPQMLIFGVIAIALAFFSLRDRKTRKTNTRIICLALIPVAIVAAMAGAYNLSRFGSPLDFGANYNLTTNDMTHRGWNFDRLPLAFFAYLFEPFVFSLSSMTFLPVNLDYTYYGTTISQTMHGGILALIPIIPCSILALHKKATRNELFALVSILILCSIAIISFDANGAGILMRYFADFGLLLSFAACIAEMTTLTRLNPMKDQSEQVQATCSERQIIRKSFVIAIVISITLQFIEIGIFAV